MEDKRGIKKLTLFEAASIVAGLGVGGGVMAVPYLASLNGYFTFIAVMLLSYLLSILLHLMIAEIVIRDGTANQLVEILGKYLFPRLIKLRSFFLWFFFVLISVSFYALLAGYIAGAGEILADLSSMPLWAGMLLFYAVAAGVVFFGLKALGLSEKYAILTAAVILSVLAFGSLANPAGSLDLTFYGDKATLALYGMIMFSFSSFFSIPQAVEGLSWNLKLAPKSVMLGLGINFLFTFVVASLAMLASDAVTEMAIIGWGRAIGNWASVIGSLFILVAILTSYWATSYALAIIIVERLNLQYRFSWLIATLPTLLLALPGLTGFLGFMRIAGGAIAILVALLVIPALRTSRAAIKYSSFDLGPLGSSGFQLLVLLAYIIMAVGSLMPL
jgi:amino acid permease